MKGMELTLREMEQKGMSPNQVHFCYAGFYQHLKRLSGLMKRQFIVVARLMMSLWGAQFTYICMMWGHGGCLQGV